MPTSNPYQSQTSELEKAGLFWNWFSENQNKLLFANEATSAHTAKFIKQLSVELEKYHPNLFFEMGRKPGSNKIQFVITAAGNIDHFEDVELLCSRAPVFDEWEIVAFKPAIGVNFKLQYRGIELNPKTIIFIPLDNTETPEAVGLHVCFDNLNENNREILIGGTYLILDGILGEKSTTLDIDYLDIIKTPADINSYDFKYLFEIGELIKEKKGRL